MFRFMTVVAAGAMLFAISGCGGDSDSEAEKEAEAGRGTITCSGDEIQATGLPAGFPELEGVTFVKQVDKGPTHVVDGYSDESLEGLYNEYKEHLKEEQYTILFDELEDDDSEISYKSQDGATSGQIALRATCDNDNVSVHITARPE